MSSQALVTQVPGAIEQPSTHPVIEAALRKGPMSAQLTRLAAFTPSTLTEAIALAKLMSRSELVPKEYRNKPENCLVGMQYAVELGISPLLGIQNIAIINGRASVWGDLFLALIQASPQYEFHEEKKIGTPFQDDYGWTCSMKRKGSPLHTVTFTVATARLAKLWGKKGYQGQDTPWITSPDRMLQMRARGFAGRDKFSDALKGLIIAEEAMDIPVDPSEAKKARDNASLEIEPSTSSSVSVPAIPATVDALSASQEPNRGHGNEGMQKTPARRADDVMCNECRAINGHLPNCSQKNKTVDAKSEQDRKTSAPTHTLTVVIESIEKQTRKATAKQKGGQVYLLLNVIDGRNNKFPIYVWKTDLHEYLVPAVNQHLTGEFKESEPDQQQRVFVSLEHIIAVGNQKFVDDKPVTQDAVMPPTGKTLFGTETSEREPGEDEEEDKF